MRSQRTWLLSLLAIFIAALTACQLITDQPAPPGTEPIVLLPTVAEQVTPPPPTLIADLAPTETAPAQPSATPSASATLPPTSTPVPTNTSSPTLTPTPTHPLMIEVMRAKSFPGSEITFLETLPSGVNHNRYIVSYESEGHTIQAYLTIPWGEPPATGWPIIIFNHGYIPPEQYRTARNYVNYVAPFAVADYIVIASDYRGHGSSEGEALIVYRDPGYTSDVLNAIAAVKTLPEADPNRIGMWGHSMGGWITLNSMVISNEIKAGVIWGGVVVSYPDLFTLWVRDRDRDLTPDPTREGRGRWRIDMQEQFGTPEENPAFWATLSANSYLSDLSGPLQLHHATGDESVPVIFSEILQAEAETAGVSSELYLYEGDDHNIAANYWTAMNRSVAFFDIHLKSP